MYTQLCGLPQDMVAIFSVKNKEIGNILLKKEPYLEQKERAKPKTIAKAAALAVGVLKDPITTCR